MRLARSCAIFGRGHYIPLFPFLRPPCPCFSRPVKSMLCTRGFSVFVWSVGLVILPVVCIAQTPFTYRKKKKSEILLPYVYIFLYFDGRTVSNWCHMVTEFGCLWQSALRRVVFLGLQTHCRVKADGGFSLGCWLVAGTDTGIRSFLVLLCPRAECHVASKQKVKIWLHEGDPYVIGHG